jgi:hypothetical protein
LEGTEEMEAEIKSTSNEYQKLMSVARKRFKRHGFAVTCKACDRALTLCPNASEPVWIKENAEDKQSQKWERRDNIIEFIQSSGERIKSVGKFIKSAGKWSGLAVAGVIALVIVVMVAVLFWRWVTGTACPWLVSNQGTLIILCLILAGLIAIIHKARNTYAWIDNEWALFLGPLFITGVVTGISCLLAVFVFDAYWKNGTAVGLVLGVIQSVYCLVYSFIAD